MHKQKFYLFFLFGLFIFSIPQISAQTNWYVDKNATGSNNGNNWSDAWESFSAINWSSVSAGDTIYISGGSTSTTYNEQLSVGASGSSGNLIAITKGVDSGHNGKVTIQGSGSSNGISISSRNYISISGFYVRGWTNSIDISSSTGTVVDNVNLYFDYGRGMLIENSSNITVKNSYMTCPSYVSAQTDGIYSQRNSSNTYEGNTIIVNNTETSGHDDCIQMYDDTDITVKNNYVEQNNSKSGNAQGIYATTMHGTSYYINNVVNLTNAQSNGLTFRRLPSLGGDGTVEMIGNTVYSIRAYHTAQITETDDPIVNNNIFYNVVAAPSFTITGWSGNPKNIDNNLYFTGSSNSVVSYNSSTKSWSQWQALGFDAHGKFANPMIADINGKDFSIRTGSPAIRAGANLGASFNTDITGEIRPTTGNWDIGAYQVSGTTTGIESDNATPNSYILSQNYPNPFNPSTTINYTIPQSSNIKIQVYDATGKEVKTLVNDFQQKGDYSISFDASRLSSGVYFYRLITANSIQTKKMILLK